MSHSGKTIVVTVDPQKPDKGVISSAARVIRLGGLVAFPTETVYGLAANRNSARAMARLSKVKNRPGGKFYTVHIADTAIIRKMGCMVSAKARALMNRYWPGPLTLVLPAGSGASVGFRMPANKVALELIRKSKVPVVAPSANLSGSKPPVEASQVLKELDGKIDMILDAGRTEVGMESTVVDMTATPFRILRKGAISTQRITRTLTRGRCKSPLKPRAMTPSF